jgi:hypothetical protein
LNRADDLYGTSSHRVGILELIAHNAKRKEELRMLDRPPNAQQGTDLGNEVTREPKPGEIYRSPANEIYRVVCVAYSPEMKDVLVVLHDLRGTGERAASLREFRGGNHPFKAYALIGVSA